MTRPFDDDMAGGRAAAEADTTEEQIYDAALEMLWADAVPGAHPDRPFYACRGCERLVDDDDARDHAMTCGKLRDAVRAEWQESDDYRPEGR